MDEGKIGKSFIATYYRLIYRSAPNLYQLYDSQAEIIRMVLSQKTRLRPAADVELVPFDIKSSVVNIKSFTTVPILEKLLISVIGSIIITNDIEKNFHQQFIIQMNDAGKWLIINDSFYDYEVPKSDLVCASIQSTTVKTVKAQQVGESTVTKRTTVVDFDPNKSITIVNLSKSYIGDEVRALFTQFGIISKQFYTFNTIYLEFNTVEMMENALKSKPPLYHGTYTKVQRGIITRENTRADFMK